LWAVSRFGVVGRDPFGSPTAKNFVDFGPNFKT